MEKYKFFSSPRVLGMFVWFLGLCFMMSFSEMKGQSCGTGSFFQWDTIHWAGLGQPVPPVRFLDNTGKEYFAQDLIMNPNGLNPECTAGMFLLEFDDLTGVPFFTDPTAAPPNLFGVATMGEVRRGVACQAYLDISDFLEDVNPGDSGRVRIRIGTGSIGIATTLPIYVFPQNFNTYLALDPEVHKTILWGFDSYAQYPMNVVVNYPALLPFHSLTNVDINLDFHYDLATPAIGPDTNLLIGEYDFYNLMVHEALHSLGIDISTSVNGITLHHTRYHKFLRYNTPPQRFMEQNPANSGIWQETTPITPSGCNNPGSLFFDYVNTALNDIETNSSYSHFLCQNVPFCFPQWGLPFTDFIMTYCQPPLSAGSKWHPNEEEKDVLCNLGYSFSQNPPVFAPSNPFQMFTYNDFCTRPCEIVGVSETITNIPFFSPITILPLANDLNAANGVVTQLRNHTPDLGTATLAGNFVVFEPSGVVNGWAVLSYVPQCANGNDGGTTYIYIEINDCDCQTVLEVGTPGMNPATPILLTQSGLPDPMPQNSCVRIHGNLVVDVPYTFSFGANIIMAPDAGIEILPFQKLTLEDFVHIHGCDYMWEGILVQSNATLAGNRDLIEEAENAIDISPFANLSFTRSRFHKNNVSLRAVAANGLNGPGLFEFDNNWIDCINDELPIPYPGGSLPFAGIETSRFLLPVMTENRFETLRNGIMATTSSLTLRDCHFTDMQNPQNTAIDGFGISSVNPIDVPTYLEVIGGGFTGLNFENCRIGVFSAGNWQDLFVLHTRMEGVGTGIWSVGHNRAQNVICYNNQIHADLMGIWYWMNVNVPNSLIRSNTVHIQDSRGIGILVSDFLATNPLSQHLIDQNILNMDDGNTGIKVDNLKSCRITGNTVTLFNPLSDNGIWVESTDFAKVQCNTVLCSGFTADDGDPVNETPVALHLQDSNDGAYLCNYLYDTYDGIRVENTCNNSRIMGNELNDHFLGMHYNFWGLSGAQGGIGNHFGNRWNGDYLNSGHIGAVHEGGSLFSIQGSIYYIEDFIGNLYPPSISLPNFTGLAYTLSGPNFLINQPWFITDITPNNDYECSLQQLCSSSSAIQEGGYGLSPTDYIIATGELQPLIYEEAVNHTAQKHLYEKLTENDSLIQDSVMENFVTESEPVAIGRLTEISVKQSELWKTTGNDSSLISGFRNLFMVYKDSLQIIDSLLRISVGSPNINPLLNEKGNILTRFTNLYAELLTDVHTWTQAKEVNRLSALSENNGYIFTEIYEQNQQQVNHIYLETVAQGIYNFSPNQLILLQSISEQCPVSGGRAVYGARALLSLIDPFILYDDKGLCNEQSIPYRVKHDVTIHNTEYTIYPNPAEETLNLVLNDREDRCLEIEIMNYLGVKIKIENINILSGKGVINISDLAEGVYILFVKGEGIDNPYCKLIINHTK